MPHPILLFQRGASLKVPLPTNLTPNWGNVLLVLVASYLLLEAVSNGFSHSKFVCYGALWQKNRKKDENQVKQCGGQNIYSEQAQSLSSLSLDLPRDPSMAILGPKLQWTWAWSLNMQHVQQTLGVSVWQEHKVVCGCSEGAIRNSRLSCLGARTVWAKAQFLLVPLSSPSCMENKTWSRYHDCLVLTLGWLWEGASLSF